jgi:hypothetical protein
MTGFVGRFARTLILVCSAVALGGTALAQTPDPLAVVRKMTDDCNRGDFKTAEAAFTGDGVIVDEFAPYLWQGPGFAHTYFSAFDAFSTTKGRTDQTLKIVSVIRSDLDGDFSYVAVSVVYGYKEQGRAMNETGDDVYTLHKEGGGWKIRSFTWRAGPPEAVADNALTAQPTPQPLPGNTVTTGYFYAVDGGMATWRSCGTDDLITVQTSKVVSAIRGGTCAGVVFGFNPKFTITVRP